MCLRRLARPSAWAMVLAWAVSAAVWARSMARADLVGVAPFGIVYIELSSLGGTLAVQVVTGWPSRTPPVWSTGPAAFDPDGDDGDDPLRGPEFTGFDPPPDPHWRLAWRGFGCEREPAEVAAEFVGPGTLTTAPEMHAPRRLPRVSEQHPACVTRPRFSAWCPVWTPFAATSAVVAAVAVQAGRSRVRSRRRRSAGRCVRCGYDRCGSPGRCPECGAVPG